ncbi:hypothetical protein [Neomoorella mulderi]|uniref:hypothetical protein n=1 Tax=Neomoorella mulderi TaxID=202604 RepID=UPI000B031BA6|nr:hypothetical protein [Moorella mulderi]
MTIKKRYARTILTKIVDPGKLKSNNGGGAGQEILGMYLLAVTPAAPVEKPGFGSYRDAWGCRYDNRGSLRVPLV